MKRTLSVGLLAAFLVALGCAPSQEERQAEALEDAAQELEEAASSGDLAGAADAMSDALEQAGGGERADPVPRERLRDLLPEDAGGMARRSISSESISQMGFAVSFAEAEYEGDGSTVTVKVTDMGNFPGIAMMGLGWAMGEIDRESDTGYERTITYRGQRGYERYDTPGRSGQMQVLVADRFLVEGNGNNVEMDQVRSVLDDVDFGALERMRNEGR
jgi:hypothetical protein